MLPGGVELDLPDGLRVERTAGGLVATAPGLLVTLSFQCAAPAYDALADTAAGVAASLR